MVGHYAVIIFHNVIAGTLPPDSPCLRHPLSARRCGRCTTGRRTRPWPTSATDGSLTGRGGGEDHLLQFVSPFGRLLVSHFVSVVLKRGGRSTGPLPADNTKEFIQSQNKKLLSAHNAQGVVCSSAKLFLCIGGNGDVACFECFEFVLIFFFFLILAWVHCFRESEHLHFQDKTTKRTQNQRKNFPSLPTAPPTKVGPASPI